MQKTNAMRLLDRAKISYQTLEYDENLTNGVLVAEALGENIQNVFKTLVTVASNGEHFVFVIPVNETLDLKKAAKCACTKSVEMLRQKELFDLTGYVHGGCSPLGMKKPFKTFVHSSARALELMNVSGGKVGVQIKLRPSDLQSVVGFEYADLIAQKDN